jgi:hypothetical protein
MTQVPVATNDSPLNYRQRAFARELGLAIAEGGGDDYLIKAYERAGYAPDRGNARRLAADPRVKALADEACAESLRLMGLHIGYLQAKALELLRASPTKIRRGIQIYEAAKLLPTMTARELEQLDVVIDELTWPLSEFKIDKDGVIAIKLPDKKAIIEMLAKQLGVGRDDGTNVNVGVSFEQLVQQSIQQPEHKEPV